MVFPRVRSFVSLALGQCQWATESHELLYYHGNQSVLLCSLIPRASPSRLLGFKLNHYDIFKVKGENWCNRHSNK